MPRPESAVRRRQWGAESRVTPLPTTHPKPSDEKITLARAAIVLTVALWVLYVIWTILRQFINNEIGGFRFTMEAFSYLVVVTFLTFSALMYLLARHGALQRFRAYERTPRAEIDRHFAGKDSAITVLVPSYREEPDVVRATLWSACLQEFPSVRVVLLVDDPPHPSDPSAAEDLERTRGLADEISQELSEPAARFEAARLDFEHDGATGDASADTVRRLAEHYAWAAEWISHKAETEKREDHVDDFFVNQVLLGLAGDLATTGRALATAADRDESLPAARMLELHQRLERIFRAEVATFERKLFASLSHEANKAMNLNAYIGLMGGSYRTEETPSGRVLRPVTDARQADLVIPDTEYILTLDADSLLLREYCLRLVHFMEQPGNERVGVTQTPYSSFRGAATRIERLAGATTDLQHILHQGKTHYDATFWVGANAVIRKAALEDIVETETSGGFVVKRYVQDRTVIEDTESSIDLGTHGWSLANHPERLSYSATPPDFGSLVVQRRRWANGGLLIMPKLVRQVRERRARGERVRLSEILLRVNYMASITWASFGLLFLLAYPYDSRLLSPVVLMAALPYFIAMGTDLRYSGYRFSDILRIYGFNLILLPVNLAGVLKSIEQALTGRKIPFARTPKVRNRTSVPVIYLLSPLAIIAFSVLTFMRDVQVGNWGNAAFAAFNAILATYATIAYIGIGNMIVDLWRAAIGWLFVEVPPKAPPAPPEDAEPDWRAVLYYGDESVGTLRHELTHVEAAEPAPAKQATPSREEVAS
ncbi:glycosyltransferase family 2 protein [Salinibacterium sp. GXW1014]|uniref:glycosyltransferase family 2 protein n=1 Tax=Salinibacterium sp. GXW1014 TaxID=3377838 RepID=UPI00383AAF2A